VNRSMPSRRKLAVVAAAVAAVVSAALILLIVFFPADLVAGRAAAALEERLQRPVRVGGAGVSLFPPLGVHLTGVRIGDRSEPGRPVIAADAVRMRLRLLPLLRRRLEIARVAIERLDVRVRLGGEESAQRGQPRPAGGTPEGDTGGAAQGGSPYFIVDNFRIANGRVRVLSADGTPFVTLGGLTEDLRARVSPSGDVRLTGTTHADTVLVHLPSGDLGKGIRVDLEKSLHYSRAADSLIVDKAELTLGQLPISVSGAAAGLASGSASIRVSLEGGPAEVSDILGYLPAAILHRLEGTESSGIVSLNGRVEGPLTAKTSENTLDFSLALTLSGGSLRHPDLPCPLDGIGLAALISPRGVQIERLEIRSRESSLVAAARITDYKANPRLEAEVDFDVDLGECSPIRKGAALPAMSGRATGHVALRGPAADLAGLEVTGDVSLASATIDLAGAAHPLHVHTGVLHLEHKDIEVKQLAGGIGSTDFSVTGSVENYPALFSATAVRPSGKGSAGPAPAGDRGRRDDVEDNDRRSRLTGPASRRGSREEMKTPEVPASLSLVVQSHLVALDELLPAGGGARSGDRISASDKAEKPRQEGRPGGKILPGATGRAGGQQAQSPDERTFFGGGPSSGTPAFLAALAGTIRADADSVRTNQLAAGPVRLLAVVDRGLVRIERLELGAFSGSVSVLGTIDIRKLHAPEVDLDVVVERASAAELLRSSGIARRFSGLSGFVTGSIDLDASLAGALSGNGGLDLSTVNSTGEVSLREAEIRGHPVQIALAEFLSVPQLKTLVVPEWLQPFKIEEGRLHVEKLEIETEQVGIAAKGWQSLDGRIEMNVEVSLPRGFSRGLREKLPEDIAAILFGGTGSRIRVPLWVKGSLRSPSVALDGERVAAIARTEAEKRLDEEKKRLEEEARRKAKELLDGFLKSGGAKQRDREDSGAHADTSRGGEPQANLKTRDATATETTP